MAKKTTTKSTKTAPKQSVPKQTFASFSVTGIAIPQVSDVMVAEVKKLPPNRRSAVAQLVLDFNDTFQKNGQLYQQAVSKKDLATQKKAMQDEYIAECLFINNMMRLGCSDIIEKMQLEAQKHTASGKKFDMFQVIRHSAIYYPDDVVLMQKKGYNFDAKQTIAGKSVDFTTYNLGLLQTASSRLDAHTKGMIDAIRVVQDERNKLIERYQKLEAEKKKATAKRVKAIDQEIKKLDTEFKKLNQQVDLHRAQADSLVQEFVATRQRLLKVVTLGCVGADNLSQIKTANIPSLTEDFQASYIKYQRVKTAIYNDSGSQDAQKQTKNNTSQNVNLRVNAYDPELEKSALSSLRLGQPVVAMDDQVATHIPLASRTQKA